MGITVEEKSIKRQLNSADSKVKSISNQGLGHNRELKRARSRISSAKSAIKGHYYPKMRKLLGEANVKIKNAISIMRTRGGYADEEYARLTDSVSIIQGSISQLEGMTYEAKAKAKPVPDYVDTHATQEQEDKVEETKIKMEEVTGISAQENTDNKAAIAKNQTDISVLENQKELETDPTKIAELDSQIVTLTAETPLELSGSTFNSNMATVTGLDGGGILSDIANSADDNIVAKTFLDGDLGDMVGKAKGLLGPISGSVGALTGILGGTGEKGACSGLDLSSIGSSVSGLFGSAGKLLSGGLSGLTSGLSKAAGGIGSALKSVGKNLMDPIGSLKKAGGLVTKGISGAAGLIGKGFKGATGLLGKGFSSLKKGVGNFSFDPVGALSGVMKGIGGMLGKIPSMIKGCGVAKARCTSSNLTGLLAKTNGIKFPSLPTLCGKELGGALDGIGGGAKGLNGFLSKAEGRINKSISGMASNILGNFGGNSGIAKKLRGAAGGMINSVLGEATSGVSGLFGGLSSSLSIGGLIGGVSQTEPLTKEELAELALKENKETENSAFSMYREHERELRDEPAGDLLDKMSEEGLSTADRAIYAKELKAELEGDSKYYKNTLGDEGYKKLVSDNSAMLDTIAAPPRKPSMFDGISNFFNPGPNTISTQKKLGEKNTIAKFDRNDVGGMARAQAEIAGNIGKITMPPKAEVKTKLAATAFSVDNLFSFFTNKGNTAAANKVKKKKESPSPVTLKIETDENGNSTLPQHIKDRMAFLKQKKIKQDALAAAKKAAAPEFPKQIGTLINNVTSITDSRYRAHDILKGNGQPNIIGPPIGFTEEDLVADVVYESWVDSNNNINIKDITISMESFIKREEVKNPTIIAAGEWETKVKGKWNIWKKMRTGFPGTYPPISNHAIIMKWPPTAAQKLDADEYKRAALEAHASFLAFDEAAVTYSTIYTESSYNDMVNIISGGDRYKKDFDGYSADLEKMIKDKK
jgi:hypothetical protein